MASTGLGSKLWELLEAEKHTGIRLTESNAMYPAASVSGWYFSHPASRYFGLGKINLDQVQGYARRKGMDIKAIERCWHRISGMRWGSVRPGKI
jgi:5-methyltetrahydrofolate--homocysteine methyltransferase